MTILQQRDTLNKRQDALQVYPDKQTQVPQLGAQNEGSNVNDELLTHALRQHFGLLQHAHIVSLHVRATDSIYQLMHLLHVVKLVTGRLEVHDLDSAPLVRACAHSLEDLANCATNTRRQRL